MMEPYPMRGLIEAKLLLDSTCPKVVSPDCTHGNLCGVPCLLLERNIGWNGSSRE